MPVRIPVKGVLVYRNGQQVRPEIGKPFEFTDIEIKDLDTIAPGHVRKPIREDDGTLTADNTPVVARKTKAKKTEAAPTETQGDL
jgi:hypothetical protein